MCLEQVKRTWSAIKVWDWMCHWFVRINFITNCCFMTTWPHCVHFSCSSFWHYQDVCGIMNRTPGNQFCTEVMEKMHLDCNHFFFHWLLLPLLSELLMLYCSILEKFSKSARKDVVYWVSLLFNSKWLLLLLFVLCVFFFWGGGG